MASIHRTIVDMKSVPIPGAQPLSNFPKAGGGNAPSYDPLVPTIFHEDWWLTVATGGNFDVAEVSVGGQVVGRLPFSVTKRFGLKMIRMPVMTGFLGPAIAEGEGSPNTRFLKRLETTRELLEKLPRASWQYIKCHGGISDVIAFQELGFRTYVQFTHEITPAPVEVLWEQMRNKTRNVIRKAEEQFAVTELTDAFEFMRLYERNIEGKGGKSEIDATICRNIISASLERKRGRILALRNKENQVVAANFCAWDEVSSYYLMSTRCNGSGNSAISLLLWEAIKESALKGLTFDFAGLGNRGSVTLYSGFGASISARYVAVRARPLGRLFHEMKMFIAPENCFY
jgi:hypothetical protein